MYYEIYVKPESGPCTVHERGPRGEHAWVRKEDAIGVADSAKASYPHMDFLVHSVDGDRNRTVVHDTSKQPWQDSK